jgi:hyperosmotically inducible periplasmic protein
MKFKIVSSAVLLSALMMPLVSFATDSTTDSAGEYIDDATITGKVKSTFAEDSLVKSRNVSVRTDHGVVDLTGTVGSKVESDRATVLASQIKGVRAVHNNLNVSSQ